MANAVIYARYSSHNQRDASIEDQVRVCTEVAEKSGDRIVRVYADRARSGTRTKGRSEFLRMINDAKGASWHKVYVYKYDRFARNMQDAAIYQAQLENNGAQLISAKEPLSEGPAGVLMAGVLTALNQFYSENLSENVKRGLEGNALQCKHNGAQLYGYDLGADGYYHVNEDEARVVRKAFEVFDGGGTTGDVERALQPYRSRRGAKFTKNRISEMLKNPKYAGTYVYGGHVVPGGMEAIIDVETFDRVNARLGKRHARSGDYPLSGRLYDSEGRRFVGVSGTSHNGGVYHYYRVMETGESYPQDKVEDAVYGAVSDLLASDPAMVDAIADAVMEAQAEATSKEREDVEDLRRRIADVDRRADNVVRSIAEVGPSKRLAAQLAELEAERDDLAAELDEAQSKAPELTREAVVALLRLVMTADAPRTVVDAFVSGVELTHDKISITFRVSEPVSGSCGDRSAPDTNEPPSETAGSGLKMAVREKRLWLAGADHARTPILLVGAWGFVLQFGWG